MSSDLENENEQSDENSDEVSELKEAIDGNNGNGNDDDHKEMSWSELVNI